MINTKDSMGRYTRFSDTDHLTSKGLIASEKYEHVEASKEDIITILEFNGVNT